MKSLEVLSLIALSLIVIGFSASDIYNRQKIERDPPRKCVICSKSDSNSTR